MQLKQLRYHFALVGFTAFLVATKCSLLRHLLRVIWQFAADASHGLIERCQLHPLTLFACVVIGIVFFSKRVFGRVSLYYFAPLGAVLLLLATAWWAIYARGTR